MSSQAQPVDYQHLFRSLPENFLLMTPDAVILDNTDRHEAASLKPREEVLGRTLFEAYPVADQNDGEVIAGSHEHVRRFLEPHVMPLIRYDLAVPAEQGGGYEEMYWQATHYPILDAQGRLQYILQRTQNVTEQHRAAQLAAQAEQALAESQERVRFILESLPVLIWTARPDGRHDYFNARWLAFTGRSLDEALDKELHDLIHPEDRARVTKVWQHSLATGEPYQAEYRLRRHDGAYRWILVRGVPRHNAQGELLMWVGGATDIHEQKTMVQELLDASEQQATLSDQAYRSSQQLLQQRQTFFDLLMHAPAYISIVRGAEHRYEFANLRFTDLVGHTNVVGRTVAEVFPEASEQLVAMLDGVFQTGEPVVGTELLVRLKDSQGQLRDAYFNFIYQRFEEEGKPAGITAYSYEVTELVQVRQALERCAASSGNAPAGAVAAR